MGRARIIRPRADALLTYKQAPFLLPTMRLLNSMRRFPGTFPTEQDSLILHVA